MINKRVTQVEQLRLNIKELDRAIRNIRTDVTTLKNRMLTDPEPLPQKIQMVRQLEANIKHTRELRKLEVKQLDNLVRRMKETTND